MKKIWIFSLLVVLIMLFVVLSSAYACDRGEAYTIGYWKNHGWDVNDGIPGPVTVTIGSFVITEGPGQDILKNANNKDFSMLFAQLIAAKINVANQATAPAVLSEAETWLVGQGVDWTSGFSSKDQKMQAEYYKNALDVFNNS